MGRKRRTPQGRWSTGECLEERRVLASQAVRITEFMAANTSTIADEDGEFSDWIEIHNPTDQAVSLQGWSLTDRADRPRLWSLPSALLGPGQYKLVFASGKDRSVSDGPWHTNFRLDADGEYLALVDPAGDISQDFGEIYPRQSNDSSFGLPVEQQFWIDGRSTSRYRVTRAEDAPSGSAWTQLDYADVTWSQGQSALGYDLRPSYPNMGWEGSTWDPWQLAGEGSFTDERFAIAATQGQQQAWLRATADSASRFQIETLFGLPRFTLNTLTDTPAARGTAIRRTFTVDAGMTLEFDWNFLTREFGDEIKSDFAFVVINDQLIKLADSGAAQQPTIAAYERETGSQTFRYTFPTAGSVTIGVGVINSTNRFVESALLLDDFRLDGVGSAEELFTSVISTSVADTLANQQGSLWARYRFNIEDLASVRDLHLRLRYDDGVAIYLNGQLIDRDNAPDALAWNGFATDDRNDADGLSWARFTASRSLLRGGDNVLAVHVFKSALDDSSLLIQPQLIGVGELGDLPQFLSIATPGLSNATDTFRVAEKVVFGRTHGFQSEPFSLVLSSPTPGAVIRYTLDGSTPDETTGLVYSQPLTIDRTQTIRAVAIASGYLTSLPATQSYLFVEDVLKQTHESVLAKGFPDDWGQFWQGAAADYEMDPRIIGQNGTDSFSGLYARTVRDDLLAVPTLSLVMDVDDLFGPEGIYSDPSNRGIDSERPVSIELIHPDGTVGFQQNAGIRIQGGISRYIASKMSFRLLFKDAYGAAKLNYPFFGENGPNEFDSISLRSSSGEHLVGIHYIRDEFARRLQAQMGNPVSRGTYMHLYINGVYWGLYNPTERVDAQFAVNRFGGRREDYDVYNAGDLGEEGVTAIAGTMDAWRTTVKLAEQVSTAGNDADKRAAYMRLLGKNPDGSPNVEWPVYLDVENYVDYLLLQVYTRNDDWPGRNFYFLRDRRPDSTGFKFFAWDSEFTLDQGHRATLDDVTPDGPGILFNLLATSDDFRLVVADRAAKHFAPGGAFYVESDASQWDPEHPERNVPASIYAQLASEVRSLLGPEIARWGDERGRSGNLFLRHTEWENLVQENLRTFFPTRSENLIRTLRSQRFYRDPPTILPANRYVEPGANVEIVSITNEVYFTLDGSDPRLADGRVSPLAQRYTSPFEIDDATVVTTRRRTGSDWSAIASATLFTSARPADASSLRIVEVNYHPHDASPDLGEADVAEDEFEFIELLNVSDHAIELLGVELAEVNQQGVSFQFGSQVLAAGQRVVVPRNVAAFVSRYGSLVNLAHGQGEDRSKWSYEGLLSDDRDAITLRIEGKTVQRVRYGDEEPWPVLADGGGASLVLLAPDLPADESTSYIASMEIGGSPGRLEPTFEPTVVINEVLSNPGVDGLTGDAVELFNRGATAVDLSGWYLTDSAGNLRRTRLPDGVSLLPGQYLVIDASQLGFGLSADQGETLQLIEANDRGQPSRWVDRVRFAATASGVSLGRWPDGASDLFPLKLPTFGSMNARPQLDQAIISEIHYRPLDPDGDNGPWSESAFEFVELANVSSVSLDMSGWKLQGAVDWTFPEVTQLQPGETIVVLPFNPATDSSRMLSFRLTFNASQQVRLVGPWVGQLSNAGDELRLMRPFSTDPGDASAKDVLVDRVQYKVGEGWPALPTPGMNSIQRNQRTAFGDLGTSWNLARANPGVVAFQPEFDGDLNQDDRVDVADVDRYCAAIRSGADTRLDLNGDGQLNLADLDSYLRDFLRSQPGDGNLDSLFNSKDWLLAFVAGEYDDSLGGNSTWADGDWNCDGEFSSADLVRAMQAGRYQDAAALPNLPMDVPSDAQPSANVSPDPASNDRALFAAALGPLPRRKRS